MTDISGHGSPHDHSDGRTHVAPHTLASHQQSGAPRRRTRQHRRVRPLRRAREVPGQGAQPPGDLQRVPGRHLGSRRALPLGLLRARRRTARPRRHHAGDPQSCTSRRGKDRLSLTVGSGVASRRTRSSDDVDPQRQRSVTGTRRERLRSDRCDSTEQRDDGPSLGDWITVRRTEHQLR